MASYLVKRSIGAANIASDDQQAIGGQALLSSIALTAASIAGCV